MNKFHPAVSLIEASAHEIERAFCTWTRYGRHSSPEDEKGINLLQQAYTSSEIYTEIPNRSVASENDLAENFVDSGAMKLEKVLKRWVDGRTYVRRQTNVYCD